MYYMYMYMYTYAYMLHIHVYTYTLYDCTISVGHCKRVFVQAVRERDALTVDIQKLKNRRLAEGVMRREVEREAGKDRKSVV